MINFKFVSTGYYVVVVLGFVTFNFLTATIEVADGIFICWGSELVKWLAQDNSAKWQSLLLNPILPNSSTLLYMGIHCLPVGWFIDFVVIMLKKCYWF